MRLTLLALVVAAGCSTRVAMTVDEFNAELPEALDIAWYGVYEMQTPPPAVEWITGDRLDCPGGQSWYVEGWGCVFGICLGDKIQVARLPGEKLSEITFAHELCHTKEAADGTAVGDHQGPCFVGVNYAGSAQIALSIAGL